MRDRRITLLCTPDASAEAPGPRVLWAEPILSAWPRADRPTVMTAELASFLEPGGDAPGEGALLVVGGADLTRSTLAVLADAAKGRHLPALVLAPDAERLRAFEGDGLIIERHDADPRALAAQLFALLAREPVVRRLEHEVRAARATHGGLGGEVRKLHEELNLAAAVQRELLPPDPPRRSTLDLGVLFRPAAYVSGDIYDLCWLDERRISFALADAVGHGVPAALLTMIISRALIAARAEGTPADPTSPARTMALLNRALLSASASGQRFATAVVGLLDATNGEGMLSIAGHPPPILLEPDRMTRIEPNGPLLGVFDDAPFEQAPFRLCAGATLLIHSDGFELAFPGPSASQFQTDAYLAHLAPLGDRAEQVGGVGPALHELADLLDRQSGSLHQRDDLTALAIRRPRMPSAEGAHRVADPAAGQGRDLGDQGRAAA